jgi:phosphoribosylformylglycinamidine synthase
MGIEGIKDVRIGKVIELELDDSLDATTVQTKVEQAAKSLLANPVMEDFKIQND